MGKILFALCRLLKRPAWRQRLRRIEPAWRWYIIAKQMPEIVRICSLALIDRLFFPLEIPGECDDLSTSFTFYNRITSYVLISETVNSARYLSFPSTP